MGLGILAKRLWDIRFENLSAETVDKTKLAVLGFLSGSFPGANSEVSAAQMEVWRDLSPGSCTVIAHRDTLSPMGAAAVNAAMAQVFLQEDCHERTISHPGVSVIPAALALCEADALDGRRLIEAVVSGYEAMGKIGRGLIRPGFPKNGLRPAAVLSPFGAAAAAAKALGLDAERTAHALSIASSSAGGVMEFSIAGTPEICIQNANGAKNGVYAAMLARAGLEGADSALDGRFGLGMALNDDVCDFSIPDGEDYFEIDDTFIKIYPVCGHVINTAQAIEKLTERYIFTADEVVSVSVGTSEGGATFPGVDNAGPFGGTISAMMSHQYAVASKVVLGDGGIEGIKRYADPALAEFAKRVKVSVDDEIERSGELGTRIRIELADGRVLEELQSEVIPQTEEGVIARSYRFAEGLLEKENIDRLIEAYYDMENITNVSELMVLLRGGL